MKKATKVLAIVGITFGGLVILASSDPIDGVAWVAWLVGMFLIGWGIVNLCLVSALNKLGVKL